jgi:hypothetical protein
MTAPTRSTIPVFALTSVPPGGTKAAPVTAGQGPWVDVRSLNGGKLTWLVKNGAIAPGVQGQFTFQIADSYDGTNATNVTDLWTGGGDIVPSSENSNYVDLPAEASYVRMLCYGNTTNAVTFRGALFAKA